MMRAGAIKRGAIFAVVVALLVILAPAADAATFSGIALTPSQPEPSATGVTYTIDFQGPSSSTVRCVRVQLDTAADGSGSTPPGADLSGSTLSGSFLGSWSGWSATSTGASISATSASGATPASGAVQLVVGNATNGSVAETPYYALVDTFSDVGCSSLVDHGATSLTWSNNVSVSTSVDPSLSFAVSGKNGGTCNGAGVTGVGTTSTAIALGRVDRTSMAVGAQNLFIATNAANGFSIYARSAGPLNDGRGHSIADIAASASAPAPFPAPGTEAFGYTTDSTSLSGNPTRFAGPRWAALTTSDAEVVHSGGASQTASNCIAYGITISRDTVGGYYGTSVIYTAVPSF